jgi:putative ABC transport system permease protein
MLRVTLRGLQDHLVRLLLTAFAVMLGVSFVAGTFVLRGSIEHTLNGLLTQASKGIDVSVRGVDTHPSPLTTPVPAVPLTLVDTLEHVPGVARVLPNLQGTALIAGRDGTVVRNGGAPGLGFAFVQNDPSFTLVSGRGPANAGEVAVESSTLTKAGLHVGDRTKAVIGDETREVTITGEVHFGFLFGATAVLVDGQTARHAFASDGLVPSISVTAAPGVSQSQLRDAVARVLPPSAEAVTGATMTAENSANLQTGLGFFTAFLLVFAGVALFVGSFLIVNTFSMLVGQRSRELALLRAIGASRAQVIRSVLAEAVVIGLVGSGLGILLGVLIAYGAKALIHSLLGADIASDLPVRASTILLSVLVGVVVTVLAAGIPALRASRVAPIAAMRGDATATAGGLRRRGFIGAALLVAGAVALVSSVTRREVPWMLAAAGSGTAVLGMLIVAPVATRPFVRAIAWPFVSVGGVIGKLARENSLRVPRRTATTASALMIGLALIAGLAVLAQSVKASVSSGVANELRSDYVLNGGTSPVPSSVAATASALPGVHSVATVGTVDIQVGGFKTVASATTAAEAADNFVVSMRAGRLDALNLTTVLIDARTATSQGWKVGDILDTTVGTIDSEKLVVGGIYEDSQAFSHIIVDRSLYLTAVPTSQQVDTHVFVRAQPTADLTALRASLVAIAKPYLVISVQDAGEFADAQGSAIDTLLNLLYVLLLFSVIVAVLGIINTLALSVFERTREIGLLRAIGLRRRQLSGMITIEAITTAVFGAALGTLIGLGLGVALQHGLKTQGLTTLAIPWLLIVSMLLASALVGVFAAVLPSIRAVRLNILEAIAGG